MSACFLFTCLHLASVHFRICIISRNPVKEHRKLKVPECPLMFVARHAVVAVLHSIIYQLLMEGFY